MSKLPNSNWCIGSNCQSENISVMHIPSGVVGPVGCVVTSPVDGTVLCVTGPVIVTSSSVSPGVWSVTVTVVSSTGSAAVAGCVVGKTKTETKSQFSLLEICLSFLWLLLQNLWLRLKDSGQQYGGKKPRMPSWAPGLMKRSSAGNVTLTLSAFDGMQRSFLEIPKMDQNKGDYELIFLITFLFFSPWL